MIYYQFEQPMIDFGLLNFKHKLVSCKLGFHVKDLETSLRMKIIYQYKFEGMLSMEATCIMLCDCDAL